MENYFAGERCAPCRKRNSRSGFLSSFADYRAKSSDYRVSRSRTSLQREIKAWALLPLPPNPSRDIPRGLNIGNEALEPPSVNISEANLSELTNKDGRRSPNILDADFRRQSAHGEFFNVPFSLLARDQRLFFSRSFSDLIRSISFPLFLPRYFFSVSISAIPPSLSRSFDHYSNENMMRYHFTD